MAKDHSKNYYSRQRAEPRPRIDTKWPYDPYYSGGGESTPWYLTDGLEDIENYTIYDVVASEDLASSYINVANPGVRDIVVGVAPTFGANAIGNHWQFTAASTQYLEIPVQVGNNHTVLIWFEDGGGANQYLAGYLNQTAPTRFHAFEPIASSNTTYRFGASAVSAYLPTRGSVLGINGVNAYRNGIIDATLPAWSGAASPFNYTIGARGLNGTSRSLYITGKILRIAVYPLQLSAAQMLAVTKQMVNYNQPSAHPYEATVLATNPVCYWPCTQLYGSTLFDKSGNNANGMSYYCPPGQDEGNLGLSIAGVSGDENKYITSHSDWAIRTNVDLDEFSCGGWFKINSNIANQIRILNNRVVGFAEYATVEIRNGLDVGIFMRQNATDQDNSSVVTLEDATWYLIIFYNSVTGGEHGLYVRKAGDAVATRYNIVKTNPAFNDSTPYQVLMGQEVDGNFHHIMYWDHSVTPEEISAL